MTNKYHENDSTLRRARSGAILLAVVLAHTGTPGGRDLVAREGPSDASTRILREEIPPALRLSVARGLNFLVKEQDRSSDFADEFPVAVNALVGLAFLSGGYTDLVGPERYAKAIGRATSSLLRKQEPSGYFNDSGRSRMYGHGFATLFLAEVYGMSGRQNLEVRDALRRAILVIEKSQSREGGWDYDPARAFGGRRNASSDTSITVCQTMALRAARNLGLEVDASVIARARSYIRRAQNPDGGFRYRSEGGFLATGSELPRSAAGVCILYSLGDYSSAAIQRGTRYLEKNYRDRSGSMPFFYAHYYCAQAMYQVGGARWREYFPWIRDLLIDRQALDGSWRPSIASLETSRAQCTAMALIVLQLPYRLLPIHER